MATHPSLCKHGAARGHTRSTAYIPLQHTQQLHHHHTPRTVVAAAHDHGSPALPTPLLNKAWQAVSQFLGPCGSIQMDHVCATHMQALWARQTPPHRVSQSQISLYTLHIHAHSGWNAHSTQYPHVMHHTWDSSHYKTPDPVQLPAD